MVERPTDMLHAFAYINKFRFTTIHVTYPVRIRVASNPDISRIINLLSYRYFPKTERDGRPLWLTEENDRRSNDVRILENNKYFNNTITHHPSSPLSPPSPKPSLPPIIIRVYLFYCTACCVDFDVFQKLGEVGTHLAALVQLLKVGLEDARDVFAHDGERRLDKRNAHREVRLLEIQAEAIRLDASVNEDFVNNIQAFLDRQADFFYLPPPSFPEQYIGFNM